MRLKGEGAMMIVHEIRVFSFLVNIGHCCLRDRVKPMEKATRYEILVATKDLSKVFTNRQFIQT